MGSYTTPDPLYKPIFLEGPYTDAVNGTTDEIQRFMSAYSAVKKAYVRSTGLDPGDVGYIAGRAGRQDAPFRTVQAAVTFLDTGTSILGEIIINDTVVPTNGPIVIGDGSKYVAVCVTGQPMYYGANGGLGLTRVTQQNATSDTFQLKAPAGKSHSFVLRGLHVFYNGTNTGIGIDTSAGSQMGGCLIEKVDVENMGQGIKIGSSVNVGLRDVTVKSNTNGLLLVGGAQGMNEPFFENVHVENNSNIGLWFQSGLIGHPRFESCVFESNTGPGIQVGDNTGGVSAGVRNPVFTSCWWEFPGSDMIRIEKPSSGISFDYATFIGCHFDGSNGAGGRSVIYIKGDGTSIVNGPTFINPSIGNLNGGKLLNIDTDPTNSGDGGFFSPVVIGGLGAQMKGIHTDVSKPASMAVLIGPPASTVEFNTPRNKYPAYITLRGDQFILNPLANSAQLGGVLSLQNTNPSAVSGQNLRGSVTISGAALNAGVAFGVAEPDTAYKVIAVVGATSASPAVGSTRIWITAKATTGFTVNTEVAPGSSQSVTVDWMVVR